MNPDEGRVYTVFSSTTRDPGSDRGRHVTPARGALSADQLLSLRLLQTQSPSFKEKGTRLQTLKFWLGLRRQKQLDSHPASPLEHHNPGTPGEPAARGRGPEGPEETGTAARWVAPGVVFTVVPSPHWSPALPGAAPLEGEVQGSPPSSLPGPCSGAGPTVQPRAVGSSTPVLPPSRKDGHTGQSSCPHAWGDGGAQAQGWGPRSWPGLPPPGNQPEPGLLSAPQSPDHRPWGRREPSSEVTLTPSTARSCT